MPPIPRSISLSLCCLVMTACTYTWEVGPERMADSGSAGSAGSAGDAGDPICDTLRQALADKRKDLAVCNPGGFAECQMTYKDECGCTVNSSDPFAYQYEERVEVFEQAGCSASCGACIHDGWNWKCLPDAQGDKGTCQPTP